ncbi:hypothetical protein GCM10010517_50680 [Streptosporangium fragile]|uniref:Uncharacterized protein n=1 Tax=Streptosporangium fragile TaxID=46186 RepID=A0ABP6IL31_9ACTN
MKNGVDQEPSEESPADPVDRLWTEVIREWEAHGQPKFSDIERWSIQTKQRYRLSRGTLSDWFKNRRMPKEGWDKFRVLLLYFSVDTDRWRRELWLPAERFAQDRRRHVSGDGSVRFPGPAAKAPAAVSDGTSVLEVRLSLCDPPEPAAKQEPAAESGPAAEGTRGRPSRVFAKVTAISTPVLPRPDDAAHPIKHKYRDDTVELVADLAPVTHGTTTYHAVRTPRDREGIAWMRADDLSSPSPRR